VTMASDPRGDRTDLSAARLDLLRQGAVAPAPAPQRAVVAWTLTAVLLAFALGLIANPWFERSVRSRLPGFAPTLAPTVAEVTALQARVAALEARPLARPTAATADPATGERVARVEGAVATLTAQQPATVARTDRLTTDVASLQARIDAGSAAATAALDNATTTAARAEALLVTGAVRRQIAAGARLGPLEAALRRTLGARAAPQVEAIAALGAAPVTPASLRAGLMALRPAVMGSTRPVAARTWWDSLRAGLGGVFVQPVTATATDPAARLDRADRALGAGDVATAAAEIAALPATLRPRATSWLAAAERYQAGWRAMSALELMLIDPLPLAAPAR